MKKENKISGNLYRLGMLLCLTFYFSSNLVAQTIEITPSYGYQFGTKLNYGPNYIQLEDSDQYGINLAFALDSNVMAEVTYIRHSSQLNIKDNLISPVRSKISDLNADWVLVGASKYFKEGKVKPFAGGGIGLVFLTPKNENFNLINRGLDSQTKFVFAFKAGVNIMLTDVIGINLQGNLLFPVEWGGFFIAGGSGGVSSGASVTSTTIIGGFSGGLVFKIN